jgi:DNA mismatch repair protein MutS
MRGSASHSFGVAVAKIAGMPATVVNNATQILHKLEKREPSKTVETTQIPLFPNQSIIKELQDLDIHNLTPLQALNKLADLKNKV